MRILRTSKGLSDALIKVEATKIAVAYVGQGWKNWIGGKNHKLTEIVLSPTIGSNPYAIEEIIREIGIANVHFLDKLHTKLYLGDYGVLIGSPNLSDNGFGPNGNREMAVSFAIGEDGDSIDMGKLTKIFEKYKAEAHVAYPSPESKIAKLDELHRKWQEVSRRGLGNEESMGGESPSIENWGSGLDRIHLVWWSTTEDSEYNKEVVGAALPEAAGLSQGQLSELFDEEFQFHDDDDIRIGDWVLSWRCKKDLNVSTRFWKDVSWTYVDTVIPNGYTDITYPKLAGTRSQLPQSFPHPPFILSDKVKKKILDLLNSGKFPALLGTYSDPWLLGPADVVTPRFLAAV